MMNDIIEPENFRALNLGSNKMHIYANLAIIGIITVAISAYLSFQVFDKNTTLIIISYILSLVITFILTKKELDDKYERIIDCLKKKYNKRIYKLKKEHDTATLEKTIRDGTRTLIKNAVEYFKIENIRNEMPLSAAIQNLQLDKYGQIIELLAEFSLILPDYEENQQIVEKEIMHQIEIYLIDEKEFAEFLQRIMEKYIITVGKKIREKMDQNMYRSMKECPNCAEKVSLNSLICKHCGSRLDNVGKVIPIPAPEQSDWLKKGHMLYREGNFQEAIKVFDNAIQSNPDTAMAYYNRGIIYMKLDKQTESMDDLKKAAQLGHKKAQEMLNLINMMNTQEWESN